MRIHELKITEPYFSDVAFGSKNFEIRKNDRDFKVGDILILRKWDGKKFTGSETRREITYITDYEQKSGNVVMAIGKIRSN